METNTLTIQQIPQHNHSLRTASASADRNRPEGNVPGDDGNDRICYDGPPDIDMNEDAIGMAGEGQPVINTQPSLVITDIICILGLYPSYN